MLMDTKEQMLYDATYVRHLEQIHRETQKESE